ncbi:type I-F CRISPR-associated protein Csy3 [Acinetobacter ursingii]|uniref:type I-F CRISPR-associated protein Csy3 n=1 Tax=Acinetobacter ursingii TaxID=108980 RepID=UPI0021E240D3|nr:type I-F CRISPR-associated protein Csy3 [Acinetobacter ursingii]UYF80659.1 type I-F CRISPR-associated protein Csy3 [Acinetobacter ursingii]
MRFYSCAQKKLWRWLKMAKTAKKQKFFPSVLAFEKKIIPSDGFFYSTTWKHRHESDGEAISVITQGVRGIVATRKEDQYLKPNLQTIDKSALSSKHDTLHLGFTLKFAGGLIKPSACNLPDFELQYTNVVESYIKKHGLRELAKRYAINIANARFLWRNRLLSSEIEVHVRFLDCNHKITDQKLKFNAFDYSLNHFDVADEQVSVLAERIAETLSESNAQLTIKVDCFAKMGDGQEVYPSQELVLGSKQSKILYSVRGQAAYHSQKIGNAIRTIDNWYAEQIEAGEVPVAVIPIETYGVVTQTGQAYRGPKSELDFYTLFEKYVEQGSLDKIEQEHYVIAHLIRGGVFGLAGGE